MEHGPFGLELPAVVFDGKEELEAMLKSPRRFGFRMQKAGYVAHTNPQGRRWEFDGPRRIQARLAFAKQDLSKPEALKRIRARGKHLSQQTS